MKIKLAFLEWKFKGKNISSTHKGLGLSKYDYHSGSTFDGMIDLLDRANEQELRKAILKGYQPCFWISAFGDEVKALARKIMVTLFKGGTKEVTLPIEKVKIPDLWHIAQAVRSGKYIDPDRRNAACEMILDTWHTAGWLKEHILQNEAGHNDDRQIILELTEAIKAMQKACDEWAAEFTLKKRGINWGVVNDAYLKAAHAIAKAEGGK